MIYIECSQGTDEWKLHRAGLVTASRFRDACDKLKNGAPSAKAFAYAAQVAVERISGEPADEGFVTYAMRRGTELEPVARFEYESKTGLVATEAGIVMTDDRLFAYSTDGFISDDGLIEIKCIFSPDRLVRMCLDGDLSEYLHQIQGGMWITGRRWADLVIYAPQLSSIGKSVIVKRVERDDDYIEALEADLLAFEKLVSEYESKLRAE